MLDDTYNQYQLYCMVKELINTRETNEILPIDEADNSKDESSQYILHEPIEDDQIQNQEDPSLNQDNDGRSEKAKQLHEQLSRMEALPNAVNFSSIVKFFEKTSLMH